MRDYAAAAAGAARAAAAAGRWLIGRALEFLSQEWNRADIKNPKKMDLKQNRKRTEKNRLRKTFSVGQRKKIRNICEKEKFAPKFFVFSAALAASRERGSGGVRERQEEKENNIFPLDSRPLIHHSADSATASTKKHKERESG